MGALSLGPIFKYRAKSWFPGLGALVAKGEPLIPIRSASGTAPGAAGSFILVAPTRMRVVRVDYVADTNGAGSSKIYLRKHVAGQSAAANAAVSSTNIVDLISGGIAADSTVRVPTTPTLVTTTGYTTLAAGDKLALVTPASWVGNVTVWVAVV